MYELYTTATPAFPMSADFNITAPNCSGQDTVCNFTCGTKIGLSLVTQSATISCIFVLSLLIYVTIKSRWADERHRLFRSHLDFYFFGLLLCDLIQSIGWMMNIKWVHQSGVSEGTYCTVQGMLEQFGDVGVALCTMAIAAHTFAEMILRWQEPKSFLLPIIVLAVYVVLLTLFIGIGYATHLQKQQLYIGQTTYWCWIKSKYIAEGIGLEYAWMWFAAAMNLLFYIPVFLVLQGLMVVEDDEDTRSWWRYTFRRTTPEEKQRIKANSLGFKAHRMLFYPVIYCLTVIPLAIPRIHAFVSPHSKVPPSATFFTGILFSASGFFNVVVYTFTRPALFRPTPIAGPVVTHRDILSNEEQIGSRSKLHVPNCQRRASAAGRSEDSAMGIAHKNVPSVVAADRE